MNSKVDKQNRFAETLEGEIKRYCHDSSPRDVLKWLLERQKIYIGRWLGFVALKQISHKSLVQSDFFLAIKICSDRIDSQIEKIFIEQVALSHWKEFCLILGDIQGDFSISKAQLLEPTLDKFIADL